jgi:hypothetical protein
LARELVRTSVGADGVKSVESEDVAEEVDDAETEQELRGEEGAPDDLKTERVLEATKDETKG